MGLYRSVQLRQLVLLSFEVSISGWIVAVTSGHWSYQHYDYAYDENYCWTNYGWMHNKHLYTILGDSLF